MEAVLIALAAAAGAGALWWQKARPTRAQKLLASAFDTDAEVALHVAQHECKNRGQALSSIHILYGLIQDETIVAALRDAGHDPEALETRVLAALDGATPSPDPDLDVTERVQLLYARALYSAQTANRKATCIDLWAYLAESDAAALLDGTNIAHVDVLFRLYHRHGPQRLDDYAGEVNIILRNDDYTTREIVVEILMTTFGYDAQRAETRMMETHTQGRGVVGRFPVATARTKVMEVRELTRSRGFPLWIGIEPV
jgi:ATP-dependent Clp protease adaptor protein ClpS